MITHRDFERYGFIFDDKEKCYKYEGYHYGIKFYEPNCYTCTVNQVLAGLIWVHTESAKYLCSLLRRRLTEDKLGIQDHKTHEWEKIWDNLAKELEKKEKRK